LAFEEFDHNRLSAQVGHEIVNRGDNADGIFDDRRDMKLLHGLARLI